LHSLEGTQCGTLLTESENVRAATSVGAIPIDARGHGTAGGDALGASYLEAPSNPDAEEGEANPLRRERTRAADRSGSPRRRLTVLITAYDRPEFLARALETACRQTADPSLYEVLVVSNLAAHGECVARAGSLRPGLDLRFLQVGDVSVGEMVAVGVEAAQGEVISLLNDDDEWLPEKVAETVGRFEASPRLGFLKNGVVFVDKSGAPVADARHLLSWLEEPPIGGLLIRGARPIALRQAIRWMAVDFNDSSISVRRSTLLPGLAYLRRLQTHEDTFLFFAAAIAGYDLMLVPGTLTRYRVHDNALTQADRNGGSKSMSRLQKNDQSVLLAMEAIREYAVGADRPDLLRLVAHDREYWQLVALARGTQTPRGVVARQLVRFLRVWSAWRIPSSVLAVTWSVVRIASVDLANAVYLQVRGATPNGGS
jgi:hypothetical protein